MSISRPARCLPTAPSALKRSLRPQCRKFHLTPALPERRRPRFASVKASDMGLVSKKSTNDNLRHYDEKDMAALAKKYTPEQLRAIEEGEEAVDLDDLRKQGRFRIDPYRLPYLDDLSIIQPVVDKKIRVEGTVPENSRWMNEEERVDEVSRWISQEHDEYLNNRPLSSTEGSVGSNTLEDPSFKPSRLDFVKFLENSTSMTGGGYRGSGIVAPTLPKIPSMKGQYNTKDGKDVRDPDGKYDRLKKQTGLTLDDIFGLKTKTLVEHRVVNQTRLGKIASVYVLSVAGNGQGRLGIGEGKGGEPDEARMKAVQAAIRNMKPIPRYENRTIYGEVEGKVAACEVRLMGRPPGFGLRCQHNIFEMARCAGIEDLAARVPRGRNKMNTVKATFQALLRQRIPDEVARGLGKKLVDVRKVYYGGNQPTKRNDGEGEPQQQTI